MEHAVAEGKVHISVRDVFVQTHECHRKSLMRLPRHVKGSTGDINPGNGLNPQAFEKVRSGIPHATPVVKNTPGHEATLRENPPQPKNTPFREVRGAFA